MLGKRFCVCSHIRAELKLKCSARTVGRCLNRHGYFWRAVAKKAPLKPQDIASRKAFVEKYGQHTPEWWENNLNLVLDGVTLTKAPQGLTGRKKHAAQSIGFMWMRQGEKMDPKLHTYNRYGVQQGQKVPLWGGFTGGGRFTLRLWTARPKMTKEEWAKQIPALKRAVDEAGEMGDPNKKAKVWMDNEAFLKNPGKYKAAGLLAINFPTNSGDINPIETVWAWLRRDLAKREFEDLKEDSVITASQFKQRAAQILQSYSVPETGEQYSKLSKLVRGMRKRLAKCENNKFGPCGKGAPKGHGSAPGRSSGAASGAGLIVECPRPRGEKQTMQRDRNRSGQRRCKKSANHTPLFKHTPPIVGARKARRGRIKANHGARRGQRDLA